jgi:hypothetical protein
MVSLYVVGETVNLNIEDGGGIVGGGGGGATSAGAENVPNELTLKYKGAATSTYSPTARY